MSSLRGLRQVILLSSLVGWQGALALEARAAEVPAASNTSTPVGESPKKPRSSKEAKKRKGSRVEKDAEGTEAADRFEANTVIKSKYRLNGEVLEVDPD